MGGEVKQIEIKNRTYYFYSDMIYLENFDSNLLKINKAHYKVTNNTTLDTSQIKKLIIVKMFTV